MRIDVLVEGQLDETVARKLISRTGYDFGTCYGRRGIGYLRQRLPGYNEKARFGDPILTLLDAMDTGLDCVAEIPATFLPDRSTRLLLRVVEREIESWLMADVDGMARFLSIPPSRIPVQPEREDDPKRTLVNLARRSRSVRRRDALVPRTGHSSSIGPGYVAEMQEFVIDHWNMEAARQNAQSLDRCLRRLTEWEL